MNIGVLALQGAFREHKQALERLGARVKEVRLPEHLEGVQGVVIPGGESTTIVKLMAAYGLDDALKQFHDEGGALWGTCAGAITIANDIIGHPDQPRLGLMDISVERNAYGRQVASFEADLQVEGLEQPFHAIFIRAPRIAGVGPGTKVLSTYRDDPIIVAEGRLMATVFHPELSNDDRIHRFFLEEVVPQGSK
jgi:5'-phosphate synthase pdxT subunit